MQVIDTRLNWAATAPLVDEFNFRWYAENGWTPPVDATNADLMRLAKERCPNAVAVVIFADNFERFGVVSIFCRRAKPAYI